MKLTLTTLLLLAFCLCGHAGDAQALGRLMNWHKLVEEVSVNRATWEHLMMVDPPDYSSSGEMAMRAARAMLLTGAPVSAQIRRELEVAVADKANREAAKQ